MRLYQKSCLSKEVKFHNEIENLSRNLWKLIGHSANESAFWNKMCTTWWCLCSLSLNSLLHIAHFKVQTSFAAHQPVCHLSSLPLSYLSRPCAVMTQRLIVSVFTSQGALESLFTDYKISFSVSFSELTPLSWPSQGRSHALLHAINLRRKSKTSSHAICFHPLPFCAFDKFPANIISTSSSSIRLAA